MCNQKRRCAAQVFEKPAKHTPGYNRALRPGLSRGRGTARPRRRSSEARGGIGVDDRQRAQGDSEQDRIVSPAVSYICRRWCDTSNPHVIRASGLLPTGEQVDSESCQFRPLEVRCLLEAVHDPKSALSFVHRYCTGQTDDACIRAIAFSQAQCALWPRPRSTWSACMAKRNSAKLFMRRTCSWSSWWHWQLLCPCSGTSHRTGSQAASGTRPSRSIMTGETPAPLPDGIRWWAMPTLQARAAGEQGGGGEQQ